MIMIFCKIMEGYCCANCYRSIEYISWFLLGEYSRRFLIFHSNCAGKGPILRTLNSGSPAINGSSLYANNILPWISFGWSLVSHGFIVYNDGRGLQENTKIVLEKKLDVKRWFGRNSGITDAKRFFVSGLSHRHDSLCP